MVAKTSLATGEVLALGSAPETMDALGWTDFHSRLRIGVRRIRKRPQEEDVAFLAQAIKRAYNTIHAGLNDDYNFLNFNCTAIEIQDDTAATTSITELLLGNVYDNLESLSHRNTLRKRARHYRLSTYGITDVGCNFCSNDDDALRDGTAAAAAASGDGTGLTAKPPPFADIKPVQDLLCKILKKEGNKDVFGDVGDCIIFPFESLGSWELDEAHEESNNATAFEDQSHQVQEATLSIDLAGLTCDEAQGFADCHDDLMQKIVSDALVIAYNKVNFADDYFLDTFVPMSLELVRGEDPMPAALRGATHLATVGVFRGTSHIQCRACAAANPTERDDDPFMEPFYRLKDVEAIFCEMIDLVADKIDALASLQGCSLSVVPVIEANVPALVWKTD